MHGLVRDLYKRVLIVGRDYPTGLVHVKEKWKKAIQDPTNCPSCYNNHGTTTIDAIISKQCEEEIIHAVQKGRYMIKEMIGIIKLKKYRTMNQRYGQKTQDYDPVDLDDRTIPSK